MKARVAYLVETGVIESKTVVAGKYDGRQQKIRSHATSCWVRRNSKLLKQERCEGFAFHSYSRPPLRSGRSGPPRAAGVRSSFVLRTYYEYVLGLRRLHVRYRS